MNNAVRPIFNEVFAKKEVCGSREHYMRPNEKAQILLKCASQKNKKNADADADADVDVDTVLFSTIQTDTKSELPQSKVKITGKE